MNEKQFIEEAAIHKLSHQFADAANRKDADLFASLWAEEAVWRIGPPINQQFLGRKAITEAFVHLLQTWDFFVQLAAGGHIQLKGQTARANFYVNEIARDKQGKGNYNLSCYIDELIQIEGQWYFQKRDYRVIYLDQNPLPGLAFPFST